MSIQHQLRNSATLGLVIGFLFTIRSEDALSVEHWNADLRHECLKHGGFLAPVDSAEHRKYAPDRNVDILHVTLDVTPNFGARTVAGSMSMKFKPIAKELKELKLDAVRLRISSVDSTSPLAAWQNTDSQLILTFVTPVAADAEATVTVRYAAEPSIGLYFRTPEMGYKEGETHVFTQGEAIEARHWYPCFDAPNEKFTSEITCRVPEGMIVISNGRKLSEQKDSSTGLVGVRWLQDKPHTTYLMTLVAGYFKKLEDRYKDIPISFWTPPSQIGQAQNSFADTKAVLQFMEEETGVPYPWDKYDQICVNDFVAGGMENTSATTLTDGTLFTDASENIHSSQNLVAHEIAHQWFGDLVTCKDWSHLWLNEGFATYYAHLFDGRKNGKDHMLYGLFQDARGFLNVPNDTRPIVWREFDNPMEMFGYLAYPKGSWILHMLRSQLGPGLFKRCVQTYLERHRFGLVTTEDLNRIIEELSGKSFDQFFDQYVYHAHQPQLDLSYSWDEKAKLSKLTVSQTQKIDEKVKLFRFPVAVRFVVSGKMVDRTITVSKKVEDFYFSLDAQPELVRFDPEFTVLAKVNFVPPSAMLKKQLEGESDVIGRLIAVELLSKRKDGEAVALLKERLMKDPFYGVRLEAAKALRSIHTTAAHEALLSATSQKDARVRRQVVQSIAGFHTDSTMSALLQTTKSEKNPDIISEAVRALGSYPTPEVGEVLTSILKVESYRNRIESGVIRALRSRENVDTIPVLLDWFKSRGKGLETSVHVAVLDALAWLARNESNKDVVRELLVRETGSLKQRVKLGAIQSLGTLGDPKAAPVLESFALSAQGSPERDPAQKALESIRSVKRPAAEYQNLRQDFLELQRVNKDLKKDLDDLKRRFEATTQPSAVKEKTAGTRRERTSRK